MATALDMVKKLQKKLRLAESESVTEKHGALMLDCINQAQRTLMLEDYTWDELKIYGSFTTTEDETLYSIAGADDEEIDFIANLQIGTSPPLEKKTDEDFRELKSALSGTTGQPIYYRIYAREGGNSIVIEVLPSPDATYTVDTEGFKKPALLSADGDETELDEDTVYLGALFLAKQDEGLDFEAELALFKNQLNLIGGAQSASNWGDVKAV